MILVTGAKGYIGTAVCHYLRQDGHTVLGIDNHSNHCLTNEEFVLNVDILDALALDRVFQDNPDITHVVHLAARKSVKQFQESVDTGFKLLNENLIGTANVLNAMVKHGVGQITFASTMVVNRQYSYLFEEHQMGTGASYGFSKKLCENLIHSYNADHRIGGTILYFDNVIGADFESRACDFPAQQKWLNLMPIINEVITGKREGIVVDKCSDRYYISLMDAVGMIRSSVIETSSRLNQLALDSRFRTQYNVPVLIGLVEHIAGVKIPLDLPTPNPSLISSSNGLFNTYSPRREPSYIHDAITDQLNFYRVLDESVGGVAYDKLKNFLYS
jgi:nucleoside-diphosphate-sugar epimerase